MKKYQSLMGKSDLWGEMGEKWGFGLNASLSYWIYTSNDSLYL